MGAALAAAASLCHPASADVQNTVLRQPTVAQCSAQLAKVVVVLPRGTTPQLCQELARRCFNDGAARAQFSDLPHPVPTPYHTCN